MFQSEQMAFERQDASFTIKRVAGVSRFSIHTHIHSHGCQDLYLHRPLS